MVRGVLSCLGFITVSLFPQVLSRGRGLSFPGRVALCPVLAQPWLLLSHLVPNVTAVS